jgi:hypothetical protein
MLTNSIGSTFMVVFQNNLGVPLSFLPTNALQVFPSYYQNSSYFGNCIPLNAISGATVICNATSSTKTSAGSQLNPRFILNYKICGTTCSQKIYSTIYNSSGSAVVVVAPYKSLLYTVGVSMTNNGQMVVGGIRYTSASNVVFISGLNYNLYANPASGFTFNSWIIGGNTVIGNSMLQSTYVSSNGPGTIQATFH